MITKWVNMKEHIYHEGIWDSIKSVRRKVPVFGKTTKKAASKAASQAISKVSEHAGEKAGDKIIELLHKKKQDKTPSVQSMPPLPTIQEDKPSSEINERVNQLLNGGKICKVRFM